MVFAAFEHSRPPPGTASPRVVETLGMLSYALDMTEGQPPGHTLRTAWIGLQIGRALGLDDAAQSDLMMAILLKDVGCSSNSAKVAHLYVTDDIAFKRDIRTSDVSMLDRVQILLRRAAEDASWLMRLKTILHISVSADRIETDLVKMRSERGAELARGLGLPERVQNSIRCLDEHWDGSGAPFGLSGLRIPMLANIALIAQVADVFYVSHGAATAHDVITSRAGKWFAPSLVAAFERAAEDLTLWTTLTDKDIITRLATPANEPKICKPAHLLSDDIADTFARVVDAKSPYTTDHSTRVAFFASLIADQMALTRQHKAWINRAALLHDLGKLAISNRILDKPTALNDDEWSAIKSYPYNTERLLRQNPAFSDLAPVAGAHRERLDGLGYPYGIGGSEISLEARIISVADAFDAMSAKRPYRKAWAARDAISLMQEGAGTAYDGDCVFALRSGIRQIRRRAA